MSISKKKYFIINSIIIILFLITAVLITNFNPKLFPTYNVSAYNIQKSRDGHISVEKLSKQYAFNDKNWLSYTANIIEQDFTRTGACSFSTSRMNAVKMIKPDEAEKILIKFTFQDNNKKKVSMCVDYLNKLIVDINRNLVEVLEFNISRQEYEEILKGLRINMDSLLKQELSNEIKRRYEIQKIQVRKMEFYELMQLKSDVVTKNQDVNTPILLLFVILFLTLIFLNLIYREKINLKTLF